MLQLNLVGKTVKKLFKKENEATQLIWDYYLTFYSLNQNNRIGVKILVGKQYPKSNRIQRFMRE